VDHLSTITVAGLLIIFGSMEILTGIWHDTGRRRDDWIIDVVSMTQLAFLIRPGILLTTAFLMGAIFPNLEGALAGMNFWVGLALVMLPDDFVHYWYHRLAHENNWLWPWHRTHHTTPSYHISVGFRENWLWLTFMPGLWWTSSMVYFGLGLEFIVGATIVGAHNVWLPNGLDFDRKLYKKPIIGPLYSALEHIFQSPSQHRGHHGIGKGGVPLGNYGQLLFIWDIMFGTATFLKDQRPERYGITNDPKDQWQAQLWWPFIKSKSKGSEIS